MSSMSIAGPAGRIRYTESPASSASEAGALPVVFVHGMVAHAGFWNEQVERLRGGRHAVAVDLRGHGGSEPPADGDYSPAACAADVLAVMDALGLEQVALVGHSFGTLVALALASANPERVARLVLADPPGDFTHLPAEVREAQLLPFLAALEGDGWRDAVRGGFEQAAEGGTAAARERVMAGVDAIPGDRLRGMYPGMFAFESAAALDRYLAHPGTRASAILAPANAWPFSLHQLRPALAATVLAETGHWLMLDAPGPFAAALADAIG